MLAGFSVEEQPSLLYKDTLAVRRDTPNIGFKGSDKK